MRPSITNNEPYLSCGLTIPVDTTVVLLKLALTMIRTLNYFLKLFFVGNHFKVVVFFSNHKMCMSYLWKEWFFSDYRSSFVKLWAKPESELWASIIVDPFKFCKSEKCMLHLYRCVLSIPHSVFLEHVYCEEDHVFVRLFVSLCIIILRGMFFMSPDLKHLKSKPQTGQVFFTRHCCILW